ncbi:MAG TPA: pentapeptide repeat-containing protein [Flavisolibacter sp.]|nr:pentapeptide repeat-containing protein [Flavisolibacter sp.]
MERIYIEDETFDKADFAQTGLMKGEYDNCIFTGCNFSGVDLSDMSFSECEMTDCNMSMAKLMKTAFKDVRFKNCKLLGLRFDECSHFLFSVQFENCVLHLASFYKSRLKKTRFINCNLKEADFTEADLTGAVFENCDLTDAHFERTLLEKADLRSAFNFSIDPGANEINGAKFSMSGLPGLLGKYKIVIE